MRFSPERLDVVRQFQRTGGRRGPPDVFDIFVKDPPQAAEKAEGSFHALFAPFQIFFRRRGEQAEDARGIGAVGFHQKIRVDDVLERFGHFFRLADDDVFAAELTLAALGLFGEEVAVFGALHRFLADHALRQEIGEGLIDADHAEVAQHLGVEPRVEQMQNGVLDAADVLIHRHPVVERLAVESRFGVVSGAAEAVEVPG